MAAERSEKRARRKSVGENGEGMGGEDQIKGGEARDPYVRSTIGESEGNHTPPPLTCSRSLDRLSQVPCSRPLRIVPDVAMFSLIFEVFAHRTHNCYIFILSLLTISSNALSER